MRQVTKRKCKETIFTLVKRQEKAEAEIIRVAMRWYWTELSDRTDWDLISACGRLHRAKADIARWRRDFLKQTRAAAKKARGE